MILAPRPRIEAASPAFQGGFLTTGPSGRSPAMHCTQDDSIRSQDTGQLHRCRDPPVTYRHPSSLPLPLHTALTPDNHSSDFHCYTPPPFRSLFTQPSALMTALISIAILALNAAIQYVAFGSGSVRAPPPRLRQHYSLKTRSSCFCS